MTNVSVSYRVFTGNQDPNTIITKLTNTQQLNNIPVMNDELSMLGLEVIPLILPLTNPVIANTLPASNQIVYSVQLKTTTRSEFRDNATLIAAVRNFYKSKLEMLTPGLVTASVPDIF